MTANTSEIMLRENAAAILARDRQIKARREALRSTVDFARFAGDDPWDFVNNIPAYDVQTGFFPWPEYLHKQSGYLDAKAPGIAKPIKPVFIARGHLKTTFIADHMALAGIEAPEKLHGVLADTDDKSVSRLMNISEIYKRKHVNQLFKDRLPPPEDRGAYTNDEIRLIRKRDAGQATFTAKGVLSALASLHFNGKCWMDDLVNEENYRNEEIQHELWMKIQQIIRYICVPGCEIIISGTRYAIYDAYDYILSSDSPIHKDIAQGFEVMGCVDDNGEPLNFFRYCVKPEDKLAKVDFRGVTFHPIRASLEEEKAATEPQSEWFAQMENNPIAIENAKFTADMFDKIIPATADDLANWLLRPENVREHIALSPAMAQAKQSGKVGELRLAILGDIAYSSTRHNDYSVILVAAMDALNNLYLLDGWRQRTNKDTLKDYFREVFTRRDRFAIKTPMGIETHAKEASVPLAEFVAAELGVAPPVFHDLKDNSHIKKQTRIESLSPILGAGRLFICSDFPKDILKVLVSEAIQFPNGKHEDVLDTFSNVTQVLPPTQRKANSRARLHSWRDRLPSGVGSFLR